MKDIFKIKKFIRRMSACGFSKRITVVIFFAAMVSLLIDNSYAQQNWFHKVRIAGNPLTNSNGDSIVEHAEESYVFGIEVDNDITGRYKSFLDPTEKLEAIRKVAEKAHKAGNYAFVYVAGLECITSNADGKEHTFFKDHPDWVQRDINVKPAIFGGNTAFWIDEGDEDVWISPYAKEWRKIYMDRIKQIAYTGIDGIYVDIPYWMTHFSGWENSWASFDAYTVEEFKMFTGLDVKKDIKLGDFEDPGFIKWINFRIETINNFLKEINDTIESVNPNCITIAEVYPGIGKDAVVVGADVYSLYNIVDVIAHEYSEGEYYASQREPFDWYKYIFGMKTFRAFAGNKPTWMLSYSWNNDEKVKPESAMKSLFASHIFNGVNTWDVKTFVMSSTNDLRTRKEVYKWISENSDKFYYERSDTSPVGVYFSPTTRNLFPNEYPESYFGIMYLLSNAHMNYEIITTRTLLDFNYRTLILSDIKCLSDDEIKNINSLLNKGVKLIYTGETGNYDENRNLRKKNPFGKLATVENSLYLDENIGKEYYKILNSHLNNYFYNSFPKGNKFMEYHNNLISKLGKFVTYEQEIKIDAPLNILAEFSKDVNDKTYIHLLDINELCEVCNKNLDSDSVKITFNMRHSRKVYFQPYLGKKRRLMPISGTDSLVFELPHFNRGAVIWIEN